MSKQIFVTGIALFSMFFGGGNLIYPLSVGILSGGSIFLAFMGFLISAIVLPFLGVLTVSLHEGRSEKVFEILGSKLSKVFPIVLLMFWIPLGSAPRCINLVMSSYELYGFNVHKIFFVLLYSFIVYFITIHKTKIIEILGLVMTPIIVTSIFWVLFSCLLSDWRFGDKNLSSLHLFSESVIAGLKTQDFVAAFFFSSVICDLVEKDTVLKDKGRFILLSCGIGVTLLSIVYFIMIFCGAINSSYLENLSGDQLLFGLLNHVGGQKVALSTLFVITFSCLSTSVALTVVISNYICKVTNHFCSFNLVVCLTILASAIPATLGFQVVSNIITPSMEILYPLLLLISLISMIKVCSKKYNALGIYKG